MPKLLQINSVVNTGSTGRIAEQIGQYAVSKGWESYIAYGRESNKSASVTIKIGKKAEVIMHGLYSRFFDRHGRSSLLATKAFINKIQVIGPDVIHLHNLHGYYLNYPVLFEFLAKSKIPVVWTMHDCWPLTGHCSYFSDINCLKWQAGCFKCPKRKNYPASWWIDNSRNNYQLKKSLFSSLDNMVIVPVSRWLEEIVKKSFLAKYPCHVIHNGIDLQAFTPINNKKAIRKKYSVDEKFILMGVATTWDARKGWNDYIKLSEVLSNDYRIILVGVSEKQKESLPENIIGISRTESLSELAELYSTADVLLNLSYQETFGMTTVEGFACGTPAIVYNCTASPELVTPETGIIVEPGDIDRLVKAIESFRSASKEYFTKKCRILAESRYNKTDRLQEYLELYWKMIG